MDITQLFSALQSDSGLAKEFADAIAAGKEILAKFLKDHDVNAAVEDVLAYIKDNAADLAGIIPEDLLGNVTSMLAGAVGDKLPDGVADVAAAAVSEVTGGKSGGFLSKIKSFFTGK